MSDPATLAETAYAKINLALHVRRRRADGYHELETLFAFVDSGDDLRVEAADGLTLTVSGPCAAGVPTDDSNLVLQAAKALDEAFPGGPRGAAVHLVKNLPPASGIGGGSADAAAAIRALAQLWDLPDDFGRHLGIAGHLGADVPACVASRACVGLGTGTNLELVENELAGMPVLLVNPRVEVPTGAVFKAWDGVDRGPLAQGTLMERALAGRNDLQAPALAICPVIGEVLASLEAVSPALVRMSGSGATCFALFETAESMQNAASQIAAAHPEWWQMQGKIR